MKKRILNKGKKRRTHKKGGYDKETDPDTNKVSFTYYEGDPYDEREKILRDGKIGDLVKYATNNQLGYTISEIVSGNEVDGKALKQVGDIYGMFSDPNHPYSTNFDSDSDSEGSKGGKRKTMKNKKKKKKKKKTKKRKWSMKYKKSINCKRPKGFSQKQYCKFGRKKKGGRIDWASMSQESLINTINNSNTSLEQLKSIINDLNTIDTEDTLSKTSKAGFIAIKKYNQRTSYSEEKYNWLENQADSLISESSPEDPIQGVEYSRNGQVLGGLEFHEQFRLLTPLRTTTPPIPTTDLPAPPTGARITRQRAIP